MAVLLQYRATIFSGVCLQVFWGLLNSAIVSAFYASTSEPPPIALSQAVTLIWLAQSLLQLLPWEIDPELEYLVKSGDCIYEMTRPLDLYWVYFVRSAAYRIAPALCQLIPVYAVAAVFFSLQPPSSFVVIVLFFVSVILAAILTASICVLVVISLFWTICGSGVKRLLPHFSLLLSGVALPLPLFPEWLQPILSLQPLRGVIDIPSRIHTGVIPIVDTPLYFGFQLFWIVVCVLAGRRLLGVAMKKYTIQGG
jgi:ABC-2 type transport system permease protein